MLADYLVWLPEGAATEDKHLLLGNTALMEQEGVATEALKSDAERLRGEGASVMATGDGLTTAQSVGAKPGIDEVYGEVEPADKLALWNGCRRRATLLPWPAMASTTRPRWPRPTFRDGLRAPSLVRNG